MKQPFGGRTRLAIFLLFILAASSACQTYQQQPGDRQAFEILLITDSGVAAAERVFNALVTDGKVSRENRDKAAAFHDKYARAYRIAVLALGGKVEDQRAAVANLTAAATELLQFLNSFGSNP